MNMEHARSPEQTPLTSGFLFTSSEASIRTQGRCIDVTTPAADGMTGRFGDAVKSAFHEASVQGVNEPILVGAIPFDTRQPSALFIPEHHQWFDRRTTVSAPQHVHVPPAEVAFWPAKDAFEAMVADVVSACQAGRVNKVVLSRLCDLVFHDTPELEPIMQALMYQHPQAYHFHVPLPQGALIGASPELLVSRQGRRVHSMPLAGTARRDIDHPEKDQQIASALKHSGKDTQEHRWVIESMYAVLHQYCYLLNIPAHPTLLKTPSLWHLATPLSGQLISTQTSSLALACALHPTPALGGAPRHDALRMIEVLEPFERDMFGGMVGWCDAQGNGEWVVTIRCGQWQRNQRRMRLAAGAGIVAQSDPYAEWQETGAKFTTMLQAFGLPVTQGGF